ncbi:MAG: hypothetical protein LBD37_00535 [Treponema sp.]|jgi:hypothetical protein|nr:hypothetical protein [Treponema sp.]
MEKKNGFVYGKALILIAALAASACDYGNLGGADQTGTMRPGNPEIEERMGSLAGVWYSHYAGIGRLDGYRIGRVRDFASWEGGKAAALFPDFAGIVPYVNPQVYPDDYILLYDDTVYGQADDTKPGQASWGFAYMGVVRAVNIFNGDPKRGAVVIEYIKGCAPKWLDRWSESGNGRLPFFGVYYRELDRDTVQMANAVDLAALYAGEPYYTEKATLEEAVAANSVENEAEFISWGVVIPQDRERRAP